MAGVPVVIVESGGLPVKQVDSGAAVMTVAANGLGIAVTLSDQGVPFVVEGGAPLSLTSNNGTTQGAILTASAGSILYRDGVVKTSPYTTTANDALAHFWAEKSGQRTAPIIIDSTASTPPTYEGYRVSITTRNDGTSTSVDYVQMSEIVALDSEGVALTGTVTSSPAPDTGTLASLFNGDKENPGATFVFASPVNIDVTFASPKILAGMSLAFAPVYASDQQPPGNFTINGLNSGTPTVLKTVTGPHTYSYGQASPVHTVSGAGATLTVSHNAIAKTMTFTASAFTGTPQYRIRDISDPDYPIAISDHADWANTSNGAVISVTETGLYKVLYRDSAATSAAFFASGSYGVLGVQPLALILENSGTGDEWSAQQTGRNLFNRICPIPMISGAPVDNWNGETRKINKYGQIYGLPTGSTSFFVVPFYPGNTPPGDYLVSGNRATCTFALGAVSGGIAITSSGANYCVVNVPDATGQAWLIVSGVSFTDDPTNPFIGSVYLQSDTHTDRAVLDTHATFFNPAAGFAGTRAMKWLNAESSTIGNEGYHGLQTETIWYPPQNNGNGTPEYLADAAFQRGSTVTWFNFNHLIPPAVRQDFMTRHKARLDYHGMTGHKVIPGFANEWWNNGTYPAQAIDWTRHAQNLGLFNGGVIPGTLATYEANQINMSTGATLKAFTNGQLFVYERLDFGSVVFAQCIQNAPIGTLITNTSYFTSTNAASWPGYDTEMLARALYVRQGQVCTEAAAIYGAANVEWVVETFLLEDPDTIYTRLKWAEDNYGYILEPAPSFYAGELWDWSSAPAVYKTDLSNPANLAAAVAAYKAQAITDCNATADILVDYRQTIFAREIADGKVPSECRKFHTYEGMVHRWFYHVPAANQAGILAMLQAVMGPTWKSDVIGPFIGRLLDEVGFKYIAPFIDRDFSNPISVLEIDSGGTLYSVNGFGIVPTLAANDTGLYQYQAIRDEWLARS